MANAKQTLSIIAIASGLVIAAPTGGPLVSAAHAQQAQKRIVKPYKGKLVHRRPAHRAERDDSRDYLREPEELPFGSTAWWRAMDLRQRGGFGGDH